MRAQNASIFYKRNTGLDKITPGSSLTKYISSSISKFVTIGPVAFEMSEIVILPRFKVNGQLVLGKKIFKGFCLIWAWWPYWSCDHEGLYKFLFPQPKEALKEIWLHLAQPPARPNIVNKVSNFEN